MGKCGSRSRVCQVICRYINCLYRCDRALSCRCDTFLKSTHLGCQCRLVSYCRRHTSQKRRYLGACLCKSENIVNKQKHILILNITEVFCHGKSGKTYSHTCSRRFIHLPIHQGSLVNNTAFLHLIIKVIPLTGTLSYACKHRQSAMSSSNIMDQFHDQHSLPHTCASKQTDLTTLCIRADQVNYLDTCLQDLCCRYLLFISRRRTMDRPFFFCFRCRQIVYRITKQVKYPAQTFFANRNFNGTASIHSFCPSYHSICGIHGNAAHGIITDLLCHFRSQLHSMIINLNGIQQCRQLVMGKTYVQYRPDHLHYLANVFIIHPIFTSKLYAFRTAYDLCDLLGNACLTGSVVMQI